MVRRIYVEKKPAFAVAAGHLLTELREHLGLSGLRRVRLIHRYDVDGLDEATFTAVAPLVFFEPPVDDVLTDVPHPDDAHVFAVESLPGQFDQRASSAAECVQLITHGERPLVRVATVYVLEGDLSDDDVAAAQGHVLNPVEARLADLAPVATLRADYPEPGPVETLTGFAALDAAGLGETASRLGLALTVADLEAIRAWAREGRPRRSPAWPGTPVRAPTADRGSPRRCTSPPRRTARSRWDGCASRS